MVKTILQGGPIQWGWIRYRSASHADQQLISPGDMFFEHAARVQFETFKITLD